MFFFGGGGIPSHLGIDHLGSEQSIDSIQFQRKINYNSHMVTSRLAPTETGTSSFSMFFLHRTPFSSSEATLLPVSTKRSAASGDET